MEYGTLICTKKSRRYCGKSTITNKAKEVLCYEI